MYVIIRLSRMIVEINLLWKWFINQTNSAIKIDLQLRSILALCEIGPLSWFLLKLSILRRIHPQAYHFSKAMKVIASVPQSLDSNFRSMFIKIIIIMSKIYSSVNKMGFQEQTHSEEKCVIQIYLIDKYLVNYAK